MAKSNIKGITVEIGGSTTKLDQALKGVNKTSRDLQSELRQVNKALKFDPGNTTLLEQKQRLLAESINNTKTKLDTLKEAERQAEQQFAQGKLGAEKFRALQREVIKTESELNNLKQEASEVDNALNSNESKLSKIGKAAEGLQGKLKSFASNIKDGVVKIGAALTSVTGISAVFVTDYQKAINKFQAKTTAASEDMKEFSDVIKQVYGDNFGENFQDVSESVEIVYKNLNLTGEELKHTTELALGFRDAFGTDVSESIRSCKALMDNFGITSEQAFNLLGQGQRQGLDYSGELLDSINEYSVQFSKLGFDATDMFNIFQTGMQEGAFNLDKVGDAIKEFSIRAIDGSNTTIEGFQAINMNADEMGKKFASGGDTAKEAFFEVITALKNMQDPVAQNIAGVNLFGTMWEDLGPKVITSLDDITDTYNTTRTSADRLNDIQYNDLESAIKGIWRSIQVECLQPIEEEFMPTLNEIVGEIKDNMPEIKAALSEIIKIAGKALKFLVENINWLLPLISTLASAFIGLKVVSGVAKAIDTVTKSIDNVKKGIQFFSDSLKVAKGAMTATSAGMKILGGAISFLTSPVGLVVLGITALVGGFIYLWNTSEGFRNFWIGLWEGIKETTSNVVDAICNFFTETIPNAWDSVSSFFSSVGESIVNGISWAVDGIVEFFTVTIPDSFNSFVDAIGNFISSSIDSIVTFFTQTIPNAIQTTLQWFSELPSRIGYALGYAIGAIINWGIETYNYLTTNVPIWIESVVNWFAELPGRIWTWLLNTITNIVNWGAEIYNNATNAVSNCINSVVEYFSQLPGRIWEWLLNTIAYIGNWGSEVYNSATSAASNCINSVINWFSQLPGAIWNWLVNAINNIINWGGSLASAGYNAASQLVSSIVNTVSSIPGKMISIGSNIVQGIWNGIIGAKDWLWDKITGFASGIVDGFKSALGIHSPSRVLRDMVGKFIPQGIGVGIDLEMPNLKKNINSNLNDVYDGLRDMVDYETAKTTAKIASSNLGGFIGDVSTNVKMTPQMSGISPLSLQQANATNNNNNIEVVVYNTMDKFFERNLSTRVEKRISNNQKGYNYSKGRG